MRNTIVYFGNNDPRIYKRGVENVILTQAQNNVFKKKIYAFWGEYDEVFEFENLIAIQVKKNFLSTFRFYYKILKRRNDYLVHAHNSMMTFFFPGRIDVFTVHDGLYYLRKNTKHRFRFLHFFIEKINYFKTTKIHFISEYSKKNSLYKHEKKAIYIYNTTPLEKYAKYCLQSIKKSRYTLFTVRGIQERTRIDLLIELAKKKQDIDIRIAGKGQLLNYYKDVVSKLQIDNCVFLGYISDKQVVEEYLSCDCVIVPAEYGEGFGLPIIEGYLFNKPVIASNRNALKEIIINQKYLFDNDINSIEKTLCYCMEKYTKYNYYNYYKMNYSNSIVVNKINKLYDVLA